MIGFWDVKLTDVVQLGQFAFAGALAFLIWSERPTPTFFIAAAILAAGVVMVVSASRSAVAVPDE